MLLISCPWCGSARGEPSSACGGEAHIARPADPDGLSDAAWADYLFMRRNPKGVHLERWRHASAAAGGSTSRATPLTLEILARLPDRATRRREHRRRDRRAIRRAARHDARHRLPEGGRIDRARPVGFRFNGRRYSGFAGDTLASALLANGVTSGRPQLQVSPPARHRREPASRSRTRWSGSASGGAHRAQRARDHVELYEGWRPPARTTGRASPSISARSAACSRRSSRPASTTRPSCGRRRLEALYEPADPPLGRARRGAARAPIPTATRRATPTATCWWSAAGPPAWPRRSRPAAAGARVILVEQAALGGGALVAASTIDGAAGRGLGRGQRRGARRDAERARAAAHHGVRRTTTTATSPGRAVERSPADAGRPARASGSGRSARERRSCSPPARIERPLVFAGNDLPGVMLASAVRDYLDLCGVPPGRRAVVRHRQRRAPTAPRWPCRGRPRGRGASICATVRGRAADRRASARSEVCARQGARGQPWRGGASIAVAVAPRRRTDAAAPAAREGSPATRRASPAAGPRPCISISHSGGRLRTTTPLAALSRPTRRAARAAPGGCGCAAPSPLARLPRQGHAAGAAAAAEAGLRARRRSPPRHRGASPEAPPRRSGWPGRRHPPRRGQGASSTSRTTSRSPTSSWPPGRAIGRSSMPSATPRRHGDRPGQDSQHQRARPCSPARPAGHPGGRHHDFPAALHPGDLRRARRRAIAATALQANPPDADRTPGTRERRPRSSRSATGGAPGISRNRRKHAPRRHSRDVKAARTPSACSTPRRSARSTSKARTPAEFLNWVYTNAWSNLADRPLPLRPDAATKTAWCSTTGSSPASPKTTTT